MKTKNTTFFTRSFMGIIGVAIITTIFYHYSGELVVNAISGRNIMNPGASTGFLGYLQMNNIIHLIIISFIFSLGAVPVIYRYNKEKRKIKNVFLWMIFTSLGLIIARITGDIFMRFVSIKYFGMLIGVFISTFIVMNAFTLLTQIKLTQLKKISFSFIGAVLALFLSFVFGGLELVGTWGGVPIFKFITLMFRNIVVGIALVIISLLYEEKYM